MYKNNLFFVIFYLLLSIIHNLFSLQFRIFPESLHLSELLLSTRTQLTIMSVLLKQIQKGKRLLQIFLSTESDSYRRLAGAIPPETIEAHAKRVAEELHQLPASTTTAQMR